MTFQNIDLTKKKLHLKQWLGCGTALFGKPSFLQKGYFRREGKESDLIDVYYDYSEVKYHFFTLFFFPIWPVGCYRVATLHRQYQSFEIDVYEKVVKEEEWSSKEIVQIYLHHLLVFAALFLALIFILSGGALED